MVNFTHFMDKKPTATFEDVKDFANEVADMAEDKFNISGKDSTMIYEVLLAVVCNLLNI